MRSKKEIIKNLRDDLWDLDTVTAIVEAAKREKNEKGRTMNMFVLKADHKAGREFEKFVDSLKANIDTIADVTRMQLMVQSGEHWYPIDLEVRQGNISAIIPEAGFSPITAGATVTLMTAFPKAEIYRFYPEVKTILGKERSLMI